MLTIKSIDHVVLRTDKLEQMVAFYCDVLGCNIERKLDAPVGLVQLRAGDALIDLVTIEGELGRKGGAAPSGSGINVDHLCLRLEAISESEIGQYLDSHAIKYGKFERRYGAQGFGQSIYIFDPQGNTVELRSEII